MVHRNAVNVKGARMTHPALRPALAVSAVLALAACSPQEESGAQEDAGVVNIYTARHYASDEAVYAGFTEETGVEVNVIEASGDLLIERVRADGERSNADVIITVDAGRLHRAAEADLFQPVGDLNGALAAVPETLRHPDGLWFGFASRVRIIAYSTERVDAADLPASYADLADPRWRGRLCVRSSGNVYNQSLLAALTVRLGEDAAEQWASGVVANFARAPQGGDTDQIRAIAAGECDLALVNQYYWMRLARSEDPADQAVAEATALHFPADDGGVHVNISGAGLAAGAPNEENARALLAYLLSDEGQRQFAELTNEYPAIDSVTYDNPVLQETAGFPADPVNVAELGDRNALAQRIFDRVGWP